jgi:spermidine synthase
MDSGMRRSLNRAGFWGLFATSMAILLLELALTRIFSVTMWYHFAFLTITLAMLGISIAWAMVFTARRFFSAERLPRRLSQASLAFALSTTISIIIYLLIPWKFETPYQIFFSLLGSFALLLLPFLTGGLVLAQIMTHFSFATPRLYLYDLAGAGLGCLAVVPLFYILSGPSIIILTSLLSALGGLFFAILFKRRKMVISFALVCLLFTGVIVGNQLYPFIKIVHTKTGLKENQIAERWTPIAYILLRSESNLYHGWGMSQKFNGYFPPEMVIEQDAAAGTPILQFDGDYSKLEYLTYDVTSAVYNMTQPESVFIVGPGGGRDILTAKYFNARRVVVVELNPAIVELVNEEYGDFSGKPYSLPGVETYIGEARSYLAHSDERFDLLHISMIDSWAANLSGAYVLSENNLYTVEAFGIYLDHLSEDGFLSVSRWYMGEQHGETMRLVALAIKTLQERGVEDVQSRILLVHYRTVATLIVKNSAITSEELANMERACQEKDFEILAGPGGIGADALLVSMLSPGGYEKVVADYPIDITPPVDDRPFFFQMQPLRQFFADLHESTSGNLKPNSQAGFILNSMLLLTLAFCVGFIIIPLQITQHKKIGLGKALSRYGREIGYFSLLGLGFMLVEVALLQRYILFLGHPVYAAATVLFCLLLFAGFGSKVSAGLLKDSRLAGSLRILLVFVALLVLLNRLFLGDIFQLLQGIPLAIKFLFSAVLLGILGFSMGMAFPSGIRLLLARKGEEMVPWVWGINGSFSVLASILAMFLAVYFGYSYALLAGLVAYALAIAMVR